MSHRWLTQTPAVTEYARLAPYGAGMLVALLEAGEQKTATLLELGPDGREIARAATKAPIDTYARLASGAQGDVLWAHASYRSNVVTVVRVRR